MSAIAQLLPGYWKPYANGHGYSFYMTNKTVTTRDEWWRLYTRQHDVALEAQRRYILEKLEAKPNPIVGDQLSSRQYAQILNAQTFYYGLPHDLKLAVVNQMVDTLMYNTGAMFVSDGSMEEGSVAFRLSELPDVCIQSVHNDYIGTFLAGHNVADKDVEARIANEGRRLTLNFIVPPNTEVQSDLGFPVGQAPEAAPLGLRHEALVAIVKKLGKQAPEDWRRLAAYQEKRVWPNDPPGKDVETSPTSAFGPPRMSECLNWIKAKSNIEFVADYYDLSGTTLSEDAKAKVPAVPLKVELDRLAIQEDISWTTCNADIYLFRNNRWYRDDRLQVPLTLLRQFTNEFLAHPPLKTHDMAKSASDPLELKARMDLEAQIVKELSPYQIATGLRWAAVDTHPKTGPSKTVFPFAGFADRILHERYTALFYGNLNEEEQKELIEGRLSFAELNVDQQHQAIFLMPSLLVKSSKIPVYLRLSETPKRALSLDIPGGNVRGIHLEIFCPPIAVNP